jgi:hypothetical protein
MRFEFPLRFIFQNPLVIGCLLKLRDTFRQTLKRPATKKPSPLKGLNASLICSVFVLSFCACTLNAPDPETPSPTFSLAETAPAELTPLPELAAWVDMNYTVNGICFEAAFDARNRVFVLRNAQEHIGFYDSADNSQLCSRRVGRHPVNF